MVGGRIGSVLKEGKRREGNRRERRSEMHERRRADGRKRKRARKGKVKGIGERKRLYMQEKIRI